MWDKSLRKPNGHPSLSTHSHSLPKLSSISPVNITVYFSNHIHIKVLTVQLPKHSKIFIFRWDFICNKPVVRTTLFQLYHDCETNSHSYNMGASLPDAQVTCPLWCYRYIPSHVWILSEPVLNQSKHPWPVTYDLPKILGFWELNWTLPWELPHMRSHPAHDHQCAVQCANELGKQ